MVNKVWLGLLLVVLVSCSPKVEEGRLPANDPVDAPYLQRDLLNAKIYQYSGFLAIPPVRWIALIVVKAKLNEFLDKLPLEEEVRKRVKKKIGSKEFTHQIVPFLFSMQELYMAGEEALDTNFKDHILKHFPDPNQFPGLKHTLFEYSPEKKEEDEENKKKNLNQKFIAEIITFADAMLFKGQDFTLGKRPNVNIELAERLVPHAQKLLKMVLKEFELEDKVKVEIEAILHNERQMEALTISLSEAIAVYMYKHYQMFARRYDRQKKLANWMEGELEKYYKGEESKLWSYLEEGIKHRRYAVQIVVDGLQGHLVESFSDASPNNVFLKKVHEEHTDKDNFKPKDVSVKESRKQENNFLEFLVNRKRQFNHPEYMPFFKKLYSKYRNGIAKNGVSTTPTISIRNIPMAVTGASVSGPHGTGLTNFNFLDRKRNRAYYFWGNDALELDRITARNETLNNFIRLPHLNGLNCNGQFGDGAEWAFDPMINLVMGELQRDFGDVLCVAELKRRAKKEKEASYLRKRLIKYKKKIDIYKKLRLRRLHRGTQRKRDPMPLAKAIIRNLADVENDGLPTLLFYYNPWPDHFAHFKGPFADEIVSPTGEFNRLDYWLRLITKVYKDAGVYKKTLWGMSGDHGLAPVYYLLQPEKVIFDSMNKEGIKVLVKKVSSDEGEGPKLKHPLRPESMRAYDVVVGSTAGGNHNMEFFKGQGSEWVEQPTYSDLQNLELISGQKVAMMDEIVTRLGDSLDYAAVRDGKCSVKSTRTILMRKRDDTIQKAVVIRNGDKLFYQSESDILDVRTLNPYREKPKNLSQYQALFEKCVTKAKIQSIRTWCDSEEWRYLTSFTSRPDSVGQIGNLYNTEISGTVNIFPVAGVGFNSKVPGRHAGEHFHEKDSFVGVWGSPINPEERLISEVNGSVPQVLYEWLRGKRNPKDREAVKRDGWGFSSFSHKLNFKTQ